MARNVNPRCEGVRIALAKAQRAYEIMNAFKRASVKPKNE